MPLDLATVLKSVRYPRCGWEGEQMSDGSIRMLLPQPAIDAILAALSPWVEQIATLETMKRMALTRGEAVLAFMRFADVIGHPFETWPDDLKRKFAAAIIDSSPLTPADIARTRELATEHGWELSDV